MSHGSSDAGWSPQGPVVELSGNASWALLRTKNFGHLGLSHHGVPEIFPMHYQSDGTRVLCRTAPGAKLRELTENPRVVFEVDAESDAGVWSVVVEGMAVVPGVETTVTDEIAAAFPPWIPTDPFQYVAVIPSSIRGRLFEQHRLFELQRLVERYRVDANYRIDENRDLDEGQRREDMRRLDEIHRLEQKHRLEPR